MPCFCSAGWVTRMESKDRPGSVSVVHAIRWADCRGGAACSAGLLLRPLVGDGVRVSSPLPSVLPVQPGPQMRTGKASLGVPPGGVHGQVEKGHEVGKGLRVTSPEGSPTWSHSCLWRPYLKDGHSH